MVSEVLAILGVKKEVKDAILRKLPRVFKSLEVLKNILNKLLKPTGIEVKTFKVTEAQFISLKRDGRLDGLLGAILELKETTRRHAITIKEVFEKDGELKVTISQSNISDEAKDEEYKIIEMDIRTLFERYSKNGEIILMAFILKDAKKLEDVLIDKRKIEEIKKNNQALEEALQDLRETSQEEDREEVEIEGTVGGGGAQGDGGAQDGGGTTGGSKNGPGQGGNQGSGKGGQGGTGGRGGSGSVPGSGSSPTGGEGYNGHDNLTLINSFFGNNKVDGSYNNGNNNGQEPNSVSHNKASGLAPPSNIRVAFPSSNASSPFNLTAVSTKITDEFREISLRIVSNRFTQTAISLASERLSSIPSYLKPVLRFVPVLGLIVGLSNTAEAFTIKATAAQEKLVAATAEFSRWSVSNKVDNTLSGLGEIIGRAQGLTGDELRRFIYQDYVPTVMEQLNAEGIVDDRHIPIGQIVEISTKYLDGISSEGLEKVVAGLRERGWQALELDLQPSQALPDEGSAEKAVVTEVQPLEADIQESVTVAVPSEASTTNLSETALSGIPDTVAVSKTPVLEVDGFTANPELILVIAAVVGITLSIVAVKAYRRYIAKREINWQSLVGKRVGFEFSAGLHNKRVETKITAFYPDGTEVLEGPSIETEDGKWFLCAHIKDVEVIKEAVSVPKQEPTLPLVEETERDELRVEEAGSVTEEVIEVGVPGEAPDFGQKEKDAIAAITESLKSNEITPEEAKAKAFKITKELVDELEFEKAQEVLKQVTVALLNAIEEREIEFAKDPSNSSPIMPQTPDTAIPQPVQTGLERVSASRAASSPVFIGLFKALLDSKKATEARKNTAEEAQLPTMVIAGIKDAFRSLAPPLTSYICRGINFIKEVIREANNDVKRKTRIQKQNEEFGNRVRNDRTYPYGPYKTENLSSGRRTKITTTEVQNGSVGSSVEANPQQAEFVVKANLRHWLINTDAHNGADNISPPKRPNSVTLQCNLLPVILPVVLTGLLKANPYILPILLAVGTVVSGYALVRTISVINKVVLGGSDASLTPTGASFATFKQVVNIVAGGLYASLTSGVPLATLNGTNINQDLSSRRDQVTIGTRDPILRLRRIIGGARWYAQLENLYSTTLLWLQQMEQSSLQLVINSTRFTTSLLPATEMLKNKAGAALSQLVQKKPSQLENWPNPAIPSFRSTEQEALILPREGSRGYRGDNRGFVAIKVSSPLKVTRRSFIKSIGGLGAAFVLAAFTGEVSAQKRPDRPSPEATLDELVNWYLDRIVPENHPDRENIIYNLRGALIAVIVRAPSHWESIVKNNLPIVLAPPQFFREENGFVTVALLKEFTVCFKKVYAILLPEHRLAYMTATEIARLIVHEAQHAMDLVAGMTMATLEGYLMLEERAFAAESKTFGGTNDFEIYREQYIKDYEEFRKSHNIDKWFNYIYAELPGVVIAIGAISYTLWSLRERKRASLSVGTKKDTASSSQSTSSPVQGVLKGFVVTPLILLVLSGYAQAFDSPQTSPKVTKEDTVSTEEEYRTPLEERLYLIDRLLKMRQHLSDNKESKELKKEREVLLILMGSEELPYIAKWALQTTKNKVDCKDIKPEGEVVEIVLYNSDRPNLRITIAVDIRKRTITLIRGRRPSSSPISRILVVDDEESIRDILSMALGKTYEVEAAEDGAKGLELFKQGEFELIITDSTMPGMNGHQLARESKKISPGTYIIMISGWLAEGSEISKDLEEGIINKFIEKPFSLAAIKDAVEAGLEEIRKASSSPIRILIVDDVTSIRNMLNQYFTRQGWTVLEAADGNEALQLLEKEDFDVILTDIAMPGMGGVTFLEKVKESGKDVSIIVMSATDYSTEDAKKLMERGALLLGAQAFIHKPFELTEGVETIKRVVEEWKSRSSSAILNRLTTKITQPHFDASSSSVKKYTANKKTAEYIRDNILLKTLAELEKIGFRPDISGHCLIVTPKGRTEEILAVSQLPVTHINVVDDSKGPIDLIESSLGAETLARVSCIRNELDKLELSKESIGLIFMRFPPPYVLKNHLNDIIRLMKKQGVLIIYSRSAQFDADWEIINGYRLKKDSKAEKFSFFECKVWRFIVIVKTKDPSGSSSAVANLENALVTSLTASSAIRPVDPSQPVQDKPKTRQKQQRFRKGTTKKDNSIAREDKVIIAEITKRYLEKAKELFEALKDTRRDDYLAIRTEIKLFLSNYCGKGDMSEENITKQCPVISKYFQETTAIRGEGRGILSPEHKADQEAILHIVLNILELEGSGANASSPIFERKKLTELIKLSKESQGTIAEVAKIFDVDELKIVTVLLGEILKIAEEEQEENKQLGLSAEICIECIIPVVAIRAARKLEAIKTGKVAGRRELAKVIEEILKSQPSFVKLKNLLAELENISSSPIQSSSSYLSLPLVKAMVEFFGGQIKGKRILEIGPGAETDLMKWLVEAGAEVWAVDSRVIGRGEEALFFLNTSKRTGEIEGAECRIADMVKFLKAYLTMYPDKPFDAMYSRGAFEVGYITQEDMPFFPVKEQIETLLEALKVMRKGALSDEGALFIELLWPEYSLTVLAPARVEKAGFKTKLRSDKLLILEKDLRALTNSLPHNTTSSPVREENDEKAAIDLAEAIRRTPYPVSTDDVIGMAKLVANLHNIELSLLSQRCLVLIKRNLYRKLPFSCLLPDKASRGVYNYLMPNLHKPEVFLLYWIHQLDSYIRVKLAGEKKEKDDGAIELHLRFEPRFDRPNTFAEILGTIGVKGKVAALKSSAEGIDIKIIFYNDRIKREVVEKLTMIREDAAYLGLKEKGKLQTRDMELSFLTFDEPGWLSQVFTAISEVDKMINVNPRFEMGEEKDSLGEIEFVSITIQLEVPSNLKDAETRIKEALEDCAVGVKITEIRSGKKQTNSSPLASSPIKGNTTLNAWIFLEQIGDIQQDRPKRTYEEIRKYLLSQPQNWWMKASFYRGEYLQGQILKEAKEKVRPVVRTNSSTKAEKSLSSSSINVDLSNNYHIKISADNIGLKERLYATGQGAVEVPLWFFAKVIGRSVKVAGYALPKPERTIKVRGEGRLVDVKSSKVGFLALFSEAVQKYVRTIDESAIINRYSAGKILQHLSQFSGEYEAAHRIRQALKRVIEDDISLPLETLVIIGKDHELELFVGDRANDDFSWIPAVDPLAMFKVDAFMSEKLEAAISLETWVEKINKGAREKGYSLINGHTHILQGLNPDTMTKEKISDGYSYFDEVRDKINVPPADLVKGSVKPSNEDFEVIEKYKINDEIAIGIIASNMPGWTIFWTDLMTKERYYLLTADPARKIVASSSPAASSPIRKEKQNATARNLSSIFSMEKVITGGKASSSIYKANSVYSDLANLNKGVLYVNPQNRLYTRYAASSGLTRAEPEIIIRTSSPTISRRSFIRITAFLAGLGVFSSQEALSIVSKLSSKDLSLYVTFFLKQEGFYNLIPSHYPSIKESKANPDYPYRYYAAYTYDMAIYAITLKLLGLNTQAEKVLSLYNQIFNSHTYQSQPNYNPTGGIFHSIRVLERTGEWWPRWDWGIMAGPMAWLGIAALIVDENKYRRLVTYIADWIIKLQDKDGGFRIGPKGQWHPQGPEFYFNTKSTENNESAIAFLDMLYNTNKQSKYKEASDRAFVWLMKMYDRDKGIFFRGARFISRRWVADTHRDFATDTASWAPFERLKDMVGVEGIERMLTETLKLTGVYDAKRDLLGLSFSISSKPAVSVEWSSQFALRALKLAKESRKEYWLDIYNVLLNNLSRYFVDVETSQIVPSRYKKYAGIVAPYAVNPRRGEPMSVPTGHGWATPVSFASVASLYYVLALIKFDPLTNKKISSSAIGINAQNTIFTTYIASSGLNKAGPNSIIRYQLSAIKPLLSSSPLPFVKSVSPLHKHRSSQQFYAVVIGVILASTTFIVYTLPQYSIFTLPLIGWLVLLKLRMYSLIGFSLASLFVKKTRPLSRLDQSVLPRVTVQVPTRNEPFEVVKMTLESAMSLEYPAEQLEIQVIDNSDKYLRDLDGQTDLAKPNMNYWRLKEFVESLSNKGLIFIHREGTEGYKAGNLNLGMNTAKGEYFLILDVDSTIPKHALLDGLPEFENGTKLGFIQFAMETTNAKVNLLTKAIAMSANVFRAHGLVKSRYGFTHFYGHNGIWKREILEKIGRWQLSVSEDLDTSIEIRLRGYHGKYCPYIVTGEWAPTSFVEFQKQLRKWAFGSTQILFRKSVKILRSQEFNWHEKIDVFLHLSQYLINAGLLLFIFATFFIPASVSLLAGIVACYITPLVPFWVQIFQETVRGNKQEALQIISRIPFLTMLYSAAIPTMILGTLSSLFGRQEGFRITFKGEQTNPTLEQIIKGNVFGLFIGIAYFLFYGLSLPLNSYLPYVHFIIMISILVGPFKYSFLDSSASHNSVVFGGGNIFKSKSPDTERSTSSPMVEKQDDLASLYYVFALTNYDPLENKHISSSSVGGIFRAGISRRQFLKETTNKAKLIVVAMFVPSFLRTGVVEGNTNFNDELLPMSLKYLDSLTKKEVKDYFTKIDNIIQRKKALKRKVGCFIWQVFKESNIAWMRAEAVKFLIRHKVITFEEAKAILDGTPDVEVVKGIYDALAENPTEEVIFFLKDRIQKEPGQYINRDAFYTSLENAKTIPQTIADEILKASQQKNFFGYRYMDSRGIWSKSLGILARKNPKAHRMLINYVKNIKDSNNKYALFQVLAEAGTPEAESLLLQVSRDPSVMKHNAWSIISGLSILSTPASEKRLLELSYEIDKYEGMFSASIYALSKLGSSDSARRLVELTREFENDEAKIADFGYSLGNVHFPEVEQRVLELSYDYREDVRKIMVYSLADLGSEKAEQRLLDWSRDRRETRTVKRFIIQGLGQLGTTSAKVRLIELYGQALKEEDFDLIDYDILKALAEYGTQKTIDWMISQLVTQQNSRVRERLSETIFGIGGFKSLELLRRRLIQVSGQEEGRLRMAIQTIVRRIDSSFLRNLNTQVDNDVQRGEEQIAIFANRLKNYSEVLYSLLALSQEVTSHSFSAFYESFKNHLERKYGNPDFVRYIKDYFGSHFMVNYLFTLAIFSELEGAFRGTKYSPNYLASLILSAKNVETFLNKPSLFAKIVINITEFRLYKYQDAFTMRILELSKENIQFKFLLKLLADFGFIKKVDQRIRSLIADVHLPPLDLVWKGPQKSWLNKDGNLQIGLYWSTAKEGERAHYSQFPLIFTNGKEINGFYKNFSGYQDLSIDKQYQQKLEEYGAERVLVKRFSETGRKVEIYLYSSLDKIKGSPHPITISRGHSGEKGSDDYPGIKGGLRLASHCRSINDSDQLISANPDSAIYYLLEYLGTQEKWGIWQDAKNFIVPHIPNSIQKYNFPTDDPSFIYGAILEKIKVARPSISSSPIYVNPQNRLYTSYVASSGLNRAGPKSSINHQPSSIKHTSSPMRNEIIRVDDRLGPFMKALAVIVGIFVYGSLLVVLNTLSKAVIKLAENSWIIGYGAKGPIVIADFIPLVAVIAVIAILVGKYLKAHPVSLSEQQEYTPTFFEISHMKQINLGKAVRSAIENKDYVSIKTIIENAETLADIETVSFMIESVPIQHSSELKQAITHTKQQIEAEYKRGINDSKEQIIKELKWALNRLSRSPDSLPVLVKEEKRKQALDIISEMSMRSPWLTLKLLWDEGYIELIEQWERYENEGDVDELVESVRPAYEALYAIYKDVWLRAQIDRTRGESFSERIRGIIETLRNNFRHPKLSYRIISVLLFGLIFVPIFIVISGVGSASASMLMQGQSYSIDLDGDGPQPAKIVKVTPAEKNDLANKIVKAGISPDEAIANLINRKGMEVADGYSKNDFLKLKSEVMQRVIRQEIDKFGLTDVYMNIFNQIIEQGRFSGLKAQAIATEIVYPYLRIAKSLTDIGAVKDLRQFINELKASVAKTNSHSIINKEINAQTKRIEEILEQMLGKEKFAALLDPDEKLKEKTYQAIISNQRLKDSLVEVLIDAMVANRGSDKVIYKKITEMLNRLGGLKSIKALIMALGYSNDDTQQYVIDALVAIGKDAVVPLSRSFEYVADPTTQVGVVRVLSRIRDDRVVEMLAKLAKYDDCSYQAQYEANRILRKYKRHERQGQSDSQEKSNLLSKIKDLFSPASAFAQEPDTKHTEFEQSIDLQITIPAGTVLPSGKIIEHKAIITITPSGIFVDIEKKWDKTQPAISTLGGVIEDILQLQGIDATWKSIQTHIPVIVEENPTINRSKYYVYVNQKITYSIDAEKAKALVDKLDGLDGVIVKQEKAELKVRKEAAQKEQARVNAELAAIAKATKTEGLTIYLTDKDTRVKQAAGNKKAELTAVKEKAEEARKKAAAEKGREGSQESCKES